MGRSSIFSLEQIYRKQVVGTWSKIPEVFRYIKNIGTDFGYTAGGNLLTQVDRIDYANDTSTASTKGPLSKSGQGIAATGNVDFGYVGWGWNQPGTGLYDTNIDRIDYSNDTATATPKGPLSGPKKYKRSATGNQSFGYFAAGGPGTFTAVFRVDYSNDTATAPAVGSLPDGEHGTAATGNESFGYIGGIWPNKSTVSRIDYSNDTATASPKGPLSQGRNEHGATGNASFGYFGGGANPSPKLSTVDRIDYSNDTATASAKGPLDRSVDRVAATGNSSSGYWSGGRSPGDSSAISKVDYTNDTATASPKGNLSATQSWHASTSSRINGFPTSAPATVTEPWTVPVGNDFGYFTAGGAPSPYYSVVDRIDFNNDTAVAATKSPTLVATRGAASVNSTTFGYSIAGGTEDAPSYKTSTVSRLSFAGDTSTQVSVANYPVAASGITGATGNTDFGYISGGYTPAVLSSVYRMDYSSDSIAASPKGPLTSSVYRNAAAGNQSFGWFAGGETPSRVSTVQRIDYGNDTATASPKGPLNLVNAYLGATGNASYGYFGGGYFTSKVDRIDYANDTPQTSPKGPLLYSFYSAATGNSSYGYWTQGSPSKTSIGRLEYANDTTTASPKGPLSLARFDTGALSSRINGFPTTVASTPVDKGAQGFEIPVPPTETFGPAYGYIPNGWPVNTRIQRIDFDNDTATTVNKGNLAQKAGYFAGMSNTTHGYVTGGLNPATQTTVQRIDYASDTSIAATKGPINYATRNSAGNMGNTTHGYIASGSGGSSRVDRITYASDTSVATSRATLATNIPGGWSVSGISDASYGYVVGGGYGGSTYIQRIDFSNDNATPSPKSNLTTARAEHGTNGNTSYAWITGGPQPGKSSVERIDYSNDTASPSPRGNITAARYNFGGTGNPNYGYFAGGGPGARTDVDRIDYGNDTATAVLKGPLNQFTSAYDGLSSQNRGQSISSPNPPSYTPRIRWVDSVAETPAVPGGPAYGYATHGLGSPGSPPAGSISTTYRIDFSNDTATPSTTGDQTQTGYYSRGVGNGSYGYILSSVPSNNTVASRIDYSNDSAACTPKGPLAYGAWEAGATGNTSYGYHGGGYDQAASVRTSKTQRLDYSSDTSVAVVKGYLAATHYRTAATGNLSYGYWGGGDNPGISSFVSRLDYASDTSLASPKGPLDFAVEKMAAVGNQTYGYFGGGRAPSTISKVQRLEWASDTTTALPKGPLSEARNILTATGSNDFGYFISGNVWPYTSSTIDRIDYSNDTAIASPKGNLPVSKYGMSSVSGQENALPNSPVAAVAAAVQRPFPFPVQSPLPIITDNLVFHLDAGNTSSYSGSGTTWNDLSNGMSGTPNNATLTNGPTFDSGNGGSIVLDGNDDRVDAGSFFNSNDNFTFSIWLNSDTFSGTNQYTIISNNSHSAAFKLQYLNGTGLMINKSWVGPNVGTFSSSTLSTGTWYNLTITRQMTSYPTKTYSLYINGSFTSSFTSGVTYDRYPTCIGKSFLETNSLWDGKIAKVFAYSTNLTASEVLRNYNADKSRFGY